MTALRLFTIADILRELSFSFSKESRSRFKRSSISSSFDREVKSWPLVLSAILTSFYDVNTKDKTA
jgi:hypothetical protein